MKDKNPLRRLVVEVPDELLHRAKVAALENRETLRALVERAIEKECKGGTPKAPAKSAPAAAPQEVKPQGPGGPTPPANNAALEEVLVRQFEEVNKNARQEHERRVAAGIIPPGRG